MVIEHQRNLDLMVTEAIERRPGRAGVQRLLTKRDLFAGVRRKCEGEECHGGYEDARNDEVESIVEGTTSDVNRKRYVDVLLWTAIVGHDVPHRRKT